MDVSENMDSRSGEPEPTEEQSNHAGNENSEFKGAPISDEGDKEQNADEVGSSNETGHLKRDFPRNSSSGQGDGNSALVCNNCGKIGHIASRCRVLKNDEPSVSILIKNLNDKTTTEDLTELCKAYGEMRDVYIPRHRRTGELQQFAFVEFVNPESVDSAVQGLNGAELLGNELTCQPARTKRKEPNRSSNNNQRRGRNDYRRSYRDDDRRYDGGRNGYRPRDRDDRRDRSGSRHDRYRDRHDDYERDSYRRDESPYRGSRRDRDRDQYRPRSRYVPLDRGDVYSKGRDHDHQKSYDDRGYSGNDRYESSRGRERGTSASVDRMRRRSLSRSPRR